MNLRVVYHDERRQLARRHLGESALQRPERVLLHARPLGALGQGQDHPETLLHRPFDVGDLRVLLDRVEDDRPTPGATAAAAADSDKELLGIFAPSAFQDVDDLLERGLRRRGTRLRILASATLVLADDQLVLDRERLKVLVCRVHRAHAPVAEVVERLGNATTALAGANEGHPNGAGESIGLRRTLLLSRRGGHLGQVDDGRLGGVLCFFFYDRQLWELLRLVVLTFSHDASDQVGYS